MGPGSGCSAGVGGKSPAGSAESDGLSGMEQTDKHRPSLLTMVLLILILVPRLWRIGYPRANFADEPLFYLPYLASSGHLPYTDFQCPYNPGWIALLAPLYALLGPSYRVAESVTAMMVVGIALLLYAVGRRRSGRHGGVAAAVLFSWHPLVIGYHVFAVEICVVLCVWSAMHLVLRRDTLSRRDRARRCAGDACLHVQEVRSERGPGYSPLPSGRPS